jgi:hypothetical protein
MSSIGHNFPPPDRLPIPEDVRPGPGWTDQMLEMADHIGPYRTLQLVERFGGMRIYIPADPERGKVYEGRGSIIDVIGIGAAAKLSAIYRREYLIIPTARYALARARRQALIASARAGRLSIAEAARQFGTSRPYMSELVNNSDEATGHRSARPSARSTGQADLFGDED